MALSMEMSLDVSQGMATIRCSLNSLPAPGVRPSNFSVYDALSPTHRTFRNHFCIRAKAAVGPCWSLAICSTSSLPQRLSQFRPAQPSRPPSWTVSCLGLSPLPPKSWLQLPSRDTLSQDCGTWPTFLQAEERWGGVPIECFTVLTYARLSSFSGSGLPALLLDPLCSPELVLSSQLLSHDSCFQPSSSLPLAPLEIFL